MSPRSALAAPSSREKILDVAERLFSRGGYAGVGLREVAEQAGLGKSSLFHHFNTKDSCTARSWPGFWVAFGFIWTPS